MTQKIIQHEIRGLYQEKLLLSLVKIYDTYEVALLASDGDDLEMYRFDDLGEAVDCYDAIRVDCWKKVRETYPFMKNIKLENVAKRIYYNPYAG